MRNATRPLLALALSFAFLVPLTGSAWGLGPGGWDNLGTNGSGGAALNGRALAFNADLPGKLIVGGVFTGAGVAPGATTADDKIAVWDGANWSTLGPLAGLPGDVHALEADPATGKIYAGGSWSDGVGPGADFIRVWDTNAPASGWQPMCSPAPGNGGNVKALRLVGTRLFVGNEGQDWDDPTDLADYLFECDTTVAGGSIIPMPGMTSSVAALAVDANGYLYAGGNFTNAHANGFADYVVKYGVLPALTPSALGGGTAIDGANVDSLATIGSDVYVGTEDVNVGTPPIAQADNVARYNSGTDLWSAPGFDNAGTNGYFGAATGPPSINALVTTGTTVFAGGNWQNANGEAFSDMVGAYSSTCVPVDDTPGPAETCWDSIGHNGTSSNGPLDIAPNSLAIFNGNLIAGGNFTNASGDTLADFISCRPLGAPCITPPAQTSAPAAPSNVFELGGLKGTKLSLTVPSAGAVKVTDSAQAAGASAITSAKKLLKPSSASGGPGVITLTLKLNKAGKQKLREKGKVRVSARITFTPTGGTASSQTSKLKIKQ